MEHVYHAISREGGDEEIPGLEMTETETEWIITRGDGSVRTFPKAEYQSVIKGAVKPLFFRE